MVFENVGIDHAEIIESASAGLQKIKEVKEKKKQENKELLEVLKESLNTYDFGKNAFNPFDLDKFTTKMKVDLAVFEQLVDKLPVEQVPAFESLLEKLFAVSKTIYELVNIEPEYFTGLNESILEESIDKRTKTIEKAIFEHLDRVFYSLSPEQRKEKYLPECKDLIKRLIQEHNLEIDDAVDFGIKVRLFENLIRNITFPRSVYARITYLTESDLYKSVFDKDYLIENLERFNEISNKIARILAAIS